MADTSGKINWFLFCPTEVVFRIFSYFEIPKHVKFVAPVCSLFNEVISDKTFKKSLRLGFLSHRLSKKVLTKYFQSFHEDVVELLLWEDNIYDRVFTHAFTHPLKSITEKEIHGLNFPNLTSLDLSHSNLLNEVICYVISKSSKIRNLSLAHTPSLSNKVLRTIAFKNLPLERINLEKAGTLRYSNTSTITPHVIAKLVQSVSSTLVHLNIKDQRPNMDVVLKALGGCTHFHSLFIRQRGSSPFGSLKPSVFEEFLQSVDLFELSMLHGESAYIRPISFHCPNLTSLSVGTFCQPGDLVDVLKGCTKLQHLSSGFNTATDEVFELLPSLPFLSSLSLELCQHMRTRSLRHVAACSGLTEVTLATVFMDSCKNDDTIHELVRNCPNIESLNLGKAHLTPSGVISLSLLRKLKELVVVLVPNLNSNRPSSYLSASPTSKGSDLETAFTKLATSCSQLRMVDITIDDTLVDSLVVPFPLHCHELERFRMCGRLVVPYHSQKSLPSPSGPQPRSASPVIDIPQPISHNSHSSPFSPSPPNCLCYISKSLPSRRVEVPFPLDLSPPLMNPLDTLLPRNNRVYSSHFCTEHCIFPFAECRSLQTLELYSDLSALLDVSEALVKLANGCPFLSKLVLGRVSGFESDVVHHLISKCKLLKSVEISGKLSFPARRALESAGLVDSVNHIK